MALKCTNAMMAVIDNLPILAGQGNTAALPCFAAFRVPRRGEIGMVQMIRGFAYHADGYSARFGQDIALDAAFAAPWLIGLRNVRKLLADDIGRLDAGTIDSVFVAVARAAGYTLAQINA